MAQTIDLTISGMHCDHCVEKIGHTLRELAGVIGCEIQMGHARVSFDQTRTDRNALLRGVRTAGAFEVTGFTVVNDE